MVVEVVEIVIELPTSELDTIGCVASIPLEVGAERLLTVVGPVVKNGPVVVTTFDEELFPEMAVSDNSDNRGVEAVVSSVAIELDGADKDALPVEEIKVFVDSLVVEPPRVEKPVLVCNDDPLREDEVGNKLLTALFRVLAVFVAAVF